jgi:hypothetical protein
MFCTISFLLGFYQIQRARRLKIPSADYFEVTDSSLPSQQIAGDFVEISQNYTTIRPPHEASATKPKTILLWNRFFYNMDYGVGFGTRPFQDEKCPVTCNLVTDRALLETADAVIIHMFYLPKDVPNATLPIRAHEKQIFVFYNLENPVRNYRGLLALDYKNIFNLTFTYLDDPHTDVYSPYGAVRKLKTPIWPSMPSQSILENKKTKDVVWLVSNCLAPSSR